MKRILGLVFGFSLLAPAVFAAQIFGTDVNIDTNPVFQGAGIVLAALGAVWIVRKVIKLLNKS